MLKRLILFIALLLSPFFSVSAQDRLAFTITPPLIKNSVEPGQLWQSSVKVVNNNTSDLVVYVQVRDFVGGAESGTVEFVETDGATTSGRYLSTWINIEGGPLTVPAQKSLDIPFIIEVPEAADPGGHYAAIMVGTQPPDTAGSGASIKISSLIGSLVLLNVAGDVEEEGTIREFSTGQELYQELPVDFAVRFENKGNVHILPQGNITIYDWWGKERGRLELNHNTDFGNVLPGGVRRYEAKWDEDLGFFDMGRYRAQLVLGYGEKARETVDQTLYFWFLDLKLAGMVVGGILFLVLAIFLMIRLYIRRAIRSVSVLAGQNSATVAAEPETGSPGNDSSGAEDDAAAVPASSSWRWFKRITILSVIVLLAAAGAIYWQAQRPGGEEVLIVPPAPLETVPDAGAGNPSPDKTIPEAETGGAATGTPSSATTTPAKESKPDIGAAKVRVENGSGRAGLAGAIADKLKAAGFTVVSTGNADNFDYAATVIRYPKGSEALAKAIADALGRKGEMEESAGDVITVVAGKDLW